MICKADDFFGLGGRDPHPAGKCQMACTRNANRAGNWPVLGYVCLRACGKPALLSRCPCHLEREKTNDNKKFIFWLTVCAFQYLFAVIGETSLGDDDYEGITEERGILKEVLGLSANV